MDPAKSAACCGHRRRGKQQGFTLVETLVAAALLISATWGAASGIKAAMTTTRIGMDRLFAVHVAQYWLDYARAYGPQTRTKALTMTDARGAQVEVYLSKTDQTATEPGKATVTVKVFRTTGPSPAVVVPGTTVTVWSYYYDKAQGK